MLVLKKLGDEQRGAFLRVLRYLGGEEGMRCVVEPHEYLKLGDAGLQNVDTYNKEEAGRRAHLPLPCPACLHPSPGPALGGTKAGAFQVACRQGS